METKTSIAELFFTRLTGMETADEKSRLDELIEKNPELGRLENELSDYANYRRRRRKLADIDVRKEFKRAFVPARRRISLRRNMVRFAIALIPLLVVGAYILMRGGTDSPESAYITPPEWGATLRLSDGTDLELRNYGRTTISDNGIEISVKDLMLDYQDATIGDVGRATDNRLIVGRNNKFKLVLNDGSVVWLNSESELRYPAVFAGAERCVSVTGEACFEVAEDKEHPFVVTLDDGSRIRVLGTKFNVRAYPGDAYHETSLLHGRVAITTSAGDLVLEPAQQAVIYPDGRYDIRTIDPASAASWIEGWFMFENKPLDYVLRMLGRWYDVDFRFGDEALRNIVISGKLRQLDLEMILEMVGTTAGVGFGIDGREVTVVGSQKQTGL